MIRILFCLFVISYCTSLFAHDTLISVATPYSSGIVHLNADSDTVSFSNGVKVFSLVFTTSAQIPEDTAWYGGIVFTFPFGTIVYKNDTSLITSWFFNGWPDLEHLSEHLNGINFAEWTQTIGNPDTNWSSAYSVPHLTYPVDSLFVRISKTEISKFNVKFLYYSKIADRSEPPIVIESQEVSNVPSVLYYICSSFNNPNMKFQCVSIEIDSSTIADTFAGRVFKNYIVSGMTIQWAIDSLGNGLFHQSVNVIMSPGNFAHSSAKRPSKLLNLGDSKQSKAIGNRSAGNRTIISLKGAKILGNKSFGVFISP